MTMCFADLVGFTALGAQVPPDELSEIAIRLNEITVALVQPPVRLIKMIGDAVMLASNESEPMLRVALDLLEATEAEGDWFPQLRIGLATGEVILRGGDIYGPPVNLASRLCDVAKPSSVLTDHRLHEQYKDDPAYRWSAAGRRRFKNIAEPVEGWRLRRQAKSTAKRSVPRSTPVKSEKTERPAPKQAAPKPAPRRRATDKPTPRRRATDKPTARKKATEKAAAVAEKATEKASAAAEKAGDKAAVAAEKAVAVAKRPNRRARPADKKR